MTTDHTELIARLQSRTASMYLLEDVKLFHEAADALEARDRRIAELETALKDVAQILAWMAYGECRGFSDSLLAVGDALDKARTAIAKVKATQEKKES